MHPSPTAPSRAGRTAATLATTAGAAAVVVGAFASPAAAATHHHHHHTEWDKVAHCESGRRWHVHTGNGFYGGLQFAQHTWRSFHGTKYAHHASHATRKEQIQVARRVLAAQGPDAWPVCGNEADPDLTMKTGHATHKKLPKHVTGTSYHKH